MNIDSSIIITDKTVGDELKFKAQAAAELAGIFYDGVWRSNKAVKICEDYIADLEFKAKGHREFKYLKELDGFKEYARDNNIDPGYSFAKKYTRADLFKAWQARSTIKG